MAEEHNHTTINDLEHTLHTCQIDLAACEEKLRILQDRYNYLNADFDNIRRRMHKELMQGIQAAQADIFLDLLPIIDDFDRALADLRAQHPNYETATWYSGLELTYRVLMKLLAKYNVEEITETQTFNPELHEAILHVADPNRQPGDIIEVLRKGYRFKDQVLRPAQVSVAQ